MGSDRHPMNNIGGHCANCDRLAKLVLELETKLNGAKPAMRLYEMIVPLADLIGDVGRFLDDDKLRQEPSTVDPAYVPLRRRRDDEANG